MLIFGFLQQFHTDQHFFGLGRSAGVGDRLLLPVEGPEGQSGHHCDEGEGKGT